MGIEEGTWPLKTPLLQVRQEVNNRNCRVRAAKTLTQERNVTGWRLPSKPGTPASPEGVTVTLFPCLVPKATCTLSHPHVKRLEKGEVIISTPGHPHARAEQRLYLDLLGRNYRHCPTASGDGKSGTRRSLGLERSLGSVDATTRVYTTWRVHTHARDFTNLPLPH